MSDLVGNPEDRFSQNEAQNSLRETIRNSAEPRILSFSSTVLIDSMIHEPSNNVLYFIAHMSRQAEKMS